MVVLLYPLALLALVPLTGWTFLLWRRGSAAANSFGILAVVTRLLLVSAVVLALADPSLHLTVNSQAVVFVSDLSASDAASSGRMQQVIDAAVRSRTSENQAGVVLVGRDAQVDQTVGPLHRFLRFRGQVNPDFTDLETGLNVAGALLPADQRRRVVVLSDGRQNVGDAVAAAGRLRAQNVRVDVVPIHAPRGPEVLVERVELPPRLHPQEHFTLIAMVRSTGATPAQLSVYRDHVRMLYRPVNLHAGETTFTFPQPPLRSAVHTFQVHIAAVRDTEPRNNEGSAITIVQGPQRVLVIAVDRQKAVNIMTSLQTTGIPAVLRLPQQVVPSLTYLQSYGSVVIVDTPADLLGDALIRLLVPYVRTFGHGLVVTGGDASYALGAYSHTPLEEVLPVSMSLQRQKDVPSVAVALLIEDLETTQNVHISKEAGKGIVLLLTRTDQVAVNDTPDDTTSGFVVHLQNVLDKAAISAAIDHMIPGDPISYVPYLTMSYQALRHSSARVKHIILLGDGDAFDPELEAVVRKIHAGGVTVSTVATEDALGLGDPSRMRSIAHWGGGRFYRAQNAQRVPQIFLREAQTLARSGIFQGKFYPAQRSESPMLRDLHTVPPLYGYGVTKAKNNAELVLASGKGDPVLAGWQYGLGRAVAWTSDAAGRWTRDWLRNPGANRFWADLVSWTLPVAASGALSLHTANAPGQGELTVNVPTKLGLNPRVTARIIDPRLHVSSVQLQPHLSGHYRATFPIGRSGAYLVHVEARGQGAVVVEDAGLNVPLSPEYRIRGTDMRFLQTLARAGGGSVIHRPRDVWADNVPPVSGNQSLADFLWLLALLLLPLDIGIRRFLVPRSRTPARLWGTGR